MAAFDPKQTLPLTVTLGFMVRANRFMTAPVVIADAGLSSVLC
jgi:hypothetical protein